MTEIGGYLQFDQLISKRYHKDMIALNSGRNALLYLVKIKNIKKVYIPYFLCHSIEDVLVKNRICVEHYSINDKFLPIFEKKLLNDEYILIVNFYGQIKDSKLDEFKREFSSIIVDNTQAFFRKPLKDIDTFYSCRKYFGIPDGAYLMTTSNIRLDLENELVKSKLGHLIGRYEGSASDYYEDYKENSLSFINMPLRKMSKFSENLLGAIDYDNVISIRNRNFEYLHEYFHSFNSIDVKLDCAPFAYPLYLKNGVEIRKVLAKKGIYIPILWPEVLEKLPTDSLEYDYAANILPLPCDQRYNLEQMKVLVTEVKSCIE